MLIYVTTKASKKIAPTTVNDDNNRHWVTLLYSYCMYCILIETPWMNYVYLKVYTAVTLFIMDISDEVTV